MQERKKDKKTRLKKGTKTWKGFGKQTRKKRHYVLQSKQASTNKRLKNPSLPNPNMGGDKTGPKRHKKKKKEKLRNKRKEKTREKVDSFVSSSGHSPLYLDAPSHLFKRVFPSVCRLSIRPSVGPLFSKVKSTHTGRIFCRVSGLVFLILSYISFFLFFWRDFFFKETDTNSSLITSTRKQIIPCNEIVFLS